MLKFLFQTTWELKHIKDKQYISVSMILGEIGKMIFGWKRSLVQNQQKLPITTLK
jgi:hypothetical protein